MSKFRTERLLYRNITVGKKDELLASVEGLLGIGGAVATVNPIMLYDAMKDCELAQALDNSVCIPDGIGICIALSKRGVHTEVFPGVELCEALLDAQALDKGVTFAIIGGREGVADGARDYLLSRHKFAECLFTVSGYGYSEEDLAKKIKEAEPDMVLVCLGSPKQEILISKFLKIAPRTLYLGLGGSLDVYSGRIKRAPKVFRRLKAEWLWRMIREPRRLSGIPKILNFATLCRMERRLGEGSSMSKHTKKPKKH